MDRHSLHIKAVFSIILAGQLLGGSLELEGNQPKVSIALSGPFGDVNELEEWELVFQDEFDVESDQWEFQNSTNYLGGYRLKERAVVRGGYLSIQNILGDRSPHPAVTTNSGGRTIEPSQWESAHLWSRESFTYGYFEARIKVTEAQSIDNAFWLMMHPIGPEIDIAEVFYWPNGVDVVNQSLHGRKPNSPIADLKMSKSIHVKADLSQEFHVYAMDWQSESVTFYFDGEVTNTVTDPKLLAYFKDQPLRLRLSTAMADIFSRDGVPDSADGTEMVVDYVSVYKRPSSAD